MLWGITILRRAQTPIKHSVITVILQGMGDIYTFCEAFCFVGCGVGVPLHSSSHFKAPKLCKLTNLLEILNKICLCRYTKYEEVC